LYKQSRKKQPKRKALHTLGKSQTTRYVKKTCPTALKKRKRWKKRRQIPKYHVKRIF